MKYAIMVHRIDEIDVRDRRATLLLAGIIDIEIPEGSDVSEQLRLALRTAYNDHVDTIVDRL